MQPPPPPFGSVPPPPPPPVPPVPPVPQPGFGAPALPVAPTAAPSPATSKKGLWIGLGALAVVAAGVAAAVVLMGGDDEPGAPANMAAAAAGLQAEIEASGVNADNVFMDTDDCLVPLSVLRPTAPDTPGVESLLGEADPFSAVIRASTGAITSVECSVGNEDQTTLVGIAVATVPSGSVEDAISGYLETFEFEFEAQQPYRGGFLLSYCAKPGPDAGEFALGFCETDWVGDGVMVGIFADSVTASPAQLKTWVKAALDDLVDTIADADVTSTTAG